MLKFLQSIKVRFSLGFFSLILIFLIMLPVLYSANKSSQRDLAIIANQSGQQRRVSEMAFLVNRYAATEKEEFVDSLNKAIGEFDKIFKTIENPPQDMSDLWQSYQEMLTKTMDKITAIRKGEEVSLDEITYLRNELTTISTRLISSINFLAVELERTSLRRTNVTLIITTILLVFSITLGVFLTYASSKVTLHPILRISQELEVVSRGDLSKELDIKIRMLGVTFEDEIAQMVKSINKIIKNLRGSIEGIYSTSKEVSMVSEVIRKSSESIKQSAQAQFEAMEKTSLAIEGSDASIKAVAEDTEELRKDTESASASSIEISAAVSDVAENVEKLAVSVDRTASSISEIAVSLRQVAAHVDTLSHTTEEVVSATTEINSTIKEVGIHSREQAVLSEKVKRDASTLGVEAMNKTRAGMEKIKEEVSVTADAINRLGERSTEIGTIIGVIDEIADTTNLLALNAAILAAQAGEHGKGFTVVSNEVKGLAKNTAAKTKEVAELIGQVQTEVAAAISSMEHTSSKVTEGVKLSREAGEALTKIVESSDVSLEMAKKIEKATEEQSKGVGQVTESIQRINSMVEEIKKATDEQKRASEEILHTTEDMKDITQNVRRSTQEQSKEGKHISQVIADVAQKMHASAHAVKEQKIASEMVVKTIETIRKKTDENVSLTLELDRAVKNLDKQAISLNEKVSSFKV